MRKRIAWPLVVALLVVAGMCLVPPWEYVSAFDWEFNSPWLIQEAGYHFLPFPPSADRFMAFDRAKPVLQTRIDTRRLLVQAAAVLALAGVWIAAGVATYRRPGFNQSVSTTGTDRADSR